ncbi:hypothetical protein [Neisseria gonorrhoeae]|nr:hypothetical protein [Neisseria gonorrhoeae]
MNISILFLAGGRQRRMAKGGFSNVRFGGASFRRHGGGACRAV